MADLSDTVLALARLINKADKAIGDGGYVSARSWLREAKLAAYEALTEEAKSD
ncbi:hypothetical protein LCGC14_3045570 [marine sediment metagenome]|uniref:Uncharacterized protein n=1 Tax=marine sediment metagenome TaxID=412755 RepID=A0A0F8ZE66_9ZZZZ